MPDGGLKAWRLEQLRKRWEADSSSRLFLQLAEEYRHVGRLDDAVEVLEAGLKSHPGYLSARVALGRCRLELGEPRRACEILEQVVAQDPTQLVASKLLVEGYLALGEGTRAAKRLTAYEALNPSDPEIEALRGQAAALRGRAPSEPVPPPAASATPARGAGGRPEGGPIFPLPGAAPPPVGLSSLSPERSARARAGAVREVHGPEPFPGLGRPEDAALLVRALAAGGIFAVELPAPVAARAEAEPAVQPVEVAVAELLAEPELAEPSAEPEPAQPRTESGAVQPRAEESLAAPPAHAEATATLGQLYLRQGHVRDAERIFRRILEREPGDEAARSGLAELEARRAGERRPPTAHELLRAAPAGDAAAPADRRIRLLRSYLARLREARRRVS